MRSEDKPTPADLTIAWSCYRPPVEATSWHRWQTIPTSSAAENDLERKLDWPLGTHAILRSAFEQALSRFSGWNLPTEPSLAAAMQQAARVYRRGVATSKQQQRQRMQGTYPIQFAPAAQQLVRNIQAQGSSVIIDQKLLALWDIQTTPQTLGLALDETTKNLESVASICEFLRSRENDDQEVWIIGGGVLSDTASFAAYLCQRRFALVPTTLLAMIDACVGGKTGINFPPFGKNQLGAFAFPERVTVCSEWLQTLPERQRLAGMSEAIKQCVLKGDLQLAEQLTQLVDFKRFISALPALIQVKAEVIQQDPSEEGLRASLNLGHTFAHALEAYSQAHASQGNYINHGEAVGLGLYLAVLLSVQAADLSPKNAERMIRILKRSNCLLPYPQLRLYLNHQDLDDPELWQSLHRYIQQDKKNHSQQSRWVLLREPGKLAVQKDAGGNPYTIPLAADKVFSAVQELCQRLRSSS